MSARTDGIEVKNQRQCHSCLTPFPSDSNGVQYDEAGNLTAGEDCFLMRYNADNQLIAVYADANTNGTLDGGDALVATYAYDALGRRIEFVNRFDGSGIYGSGPTSVTTRYLYDGQNVIEEYDAGGDRQRYFVHGTTYIDERAVMHDDVETGRDYYYLLKDLYTVVGLANRQGHEVERYVYDAYGKVTVVSVPEGDVNFNGTVSGTDLTAIQRHFGEDPCEAGTVYDRNADGAIDWGDTLFVSWPPQENHAIPASGLGNPYFFTGRRLDSYLSLYQLVGPKQVYHYRARSYDPIHGRFWQRDPAAYVDGTNLYEYVLTNPLVFVDPLGADAQALADAKAALTALHNIHRGKYYYEDNMWMTGLRPMIFDKLWWALETIGKDDIFYTQTGRAVAKYNRGWDTLHLDASRRHLILDPPTVVHELIHAYNDFTDKFEKAREDEGMAYAAEHMVTTLQYMIRIDDAMKKEHPDKISLKRNWSFAWAMIGNILTLPGAADGKGFIISATDVRNMNQQLTFKLHCNEFADLYNRIAAEKKWCIHFLCRKGPDNSLGIPVADQAVLTEKLHDVFGGD